MIVSYLLHVVLYFVSFFSILSIFLPRKGYSLKEVPRAFLLMVLSVIVVSGLNYFTVHSNYLPFIILTLAGLPTLKNLQKISLSKDERQVLIGIGIYGLVFIAYYATFATFLAGDIVTGASFIRTILEGEPLRIPLLNSHLTDYPKGFHFFASFFAGTVGIIDAIRLTSVLSLAMTLLLVYLIAEKMQVNGKGAVLFSAIFLPNYFYIFWGGFTSQFAMLFALAVILFSLKSRFLLTLVSLLMIFSIHPRIFMFLIPFAIAYLVFEKKNDKQKLLVHLLFIGLIISFLYIQNFAFRPGPKFIGSLIRNEDRLLVYSIVFLPAIFMIPSYFKIKKNILRAWLPLALIFLLYFDSTYQIASDGKRILEANYVLFALIASQIIKTRYRKLIICLLLLYGSSVMAYEFHKFGTAFTLSYNDIGEFEQASALINSSILLNLDEVCEWFFPLEHVNVSYPRAFKLQDYEPDLFALSKGLVKGGYMLTDLPVCVSVYSLEGKSTPFIKFQRISVPNDAEIVYDGSLLKIFYYKQWGTIFPENSTEWNVTGDGVLRLYNPVGGASMAFTGLDNKDVILSGEFSNVGGMARKVLFFFGNSSVPIIYDVEYIEYRGDKYYIYHGINEKASLETNKKTDLIDDRWNSFNITLVDGEITMFINNKELLTWVDPSPINITHLTFLTFKTSTKFRNVAISTD